VPELLMDVASPTWAYLVLFGLLVVDAFVPVIPTQLLMITGGALTVHGGLSLPATIATGALGVFCGDLACYLIGRTGWRPGARRQRAGPASGPAGTASGPAGTASGPAGTARGWVTPAGGLAGTAGTAVPFARSRRAARRLTRGLPRTGPLVILICRFVPGGRMAAGFRAGRARYPGHLFVAYEAVAALGWAAYGGFVGQLGGAALAGSGWRLAAVAAVAAAVFAAAGWGLALVGARGRTADPAVPPASIASIPPGGTATVPPGGTAAIPARGASVGGPPR